MLARYHDASFISDSLWAEDGPIFFGGAKSLGARSLVEPYAGYLHFYPRIFAFIASLLPFAYTPFVFFFGWVLAVVSIFWAASVALRDYRFGGLLAMLLPILIIWQPHSGETFLSCTNAQWWLAVSLAIICCFPEKFGPKTYPIVVVLSITGPFSLLFAPLTLINCYFKKSWSIALILMIGAIIQLTVMASHPRESQVLDSQIAHWGDLFKTFFTFGLKKTYQHVLAYLVWALLACSLFRAKFNSISILACAAIVFASAAYSLKGIPSALSPFGAGARYFVTPYALTMAYLFFRAADKSLPAIMAVALALIVFLCSPFRIDQSGFYFKQYAQLSEYESTTLIPIAPKLPESPGFSLAVTNPSPKDSQANAVTLKDEGGGRLLVGENLCDGYRGISFVGDGIDLMPGVFKIELQRNDSPIKTLHRFYGPGSQRIQLAAKKGKGGVRMHLMTSIGSGMVVNAKAICLP